MTPESKIELLGNLLWISCTVNMMVAAWYLVEGLQRLSNRKIDYSEELNLLRELQKDNALSIPQLAVKCNMPLSKVERIVKKLGSKSYLEADIDMKRNAMVYRSR